MRQKALVYLAIFLATAAFAGASVNKSIRVVNDFGKWTGVSSIFIFHLSYDWPVNVTPPKHSNETESLLGAPSLKSQVAIHLEKVADPSALSL